MATLSVHPTGFDSANSSPSSSSGSSYSYSNAFADSSNTTSYARFLLNSGAGASSVIIYTFNLSALPSNATINSVTCTAYGRTSATGSSAMPIHDMQLYSGSTAKGTPTEWANVDTLYTLSPGTWTATQLQSAKLRFDFTRGTSNPTTNRWLYFYGATLTVNYTEAASNELYVKQSGVWVPVTKAYKKVSGSWVEQSDLTTVFSSGTNYKEG